MAAMRAKAGSGTTSRTPHNCPHFRCSLTSPWSCSLRLQARTICPSVCRARMFCRHSRSSLVFGHVKTRRCTPCLGTCSKDASRSRSSLTRSPLHSLPTLGRQDSSIMPHRPRSRTRHITRCAGGVCNLAPPVWTCYITSCLIDASLAFAFSSPFPAPLYSLVSPVSRVWCSLLTCRISSAFCRALLYIIITASLCCIPPAIDTLHSDNLTIPQSHIHRSIRYKCQVVLRIRGC